MLEPEIYERGIFGDLILPGIACGVRKYLLIFNTNLNSPPIYVVDPRAFNVVPDSDIPLVLAYNMSHYESMHPCSQDDEQLTINLVNEFLAGTYKFQGKDINFLLAQPIERKQVNENSNGILRPTNKRYHKKAKVEISLKGEADNLKQLLFNQKYQDDSENESSKLSAGKCRQKMENYCKEKNEKKNKGNPPSTMLKHEITTPRKDCRNNIQNSKVATNVKGKVNSSNISENNLQVETLTCTLKETGHPIAIRLVDDKMECPFCGIFVKNIKLHFSRKNNCGNKIDLHIFANFFDVVQKRKNKKKNLEAVMKYQSQ